MFPGRRRVGWGGWLGLFALAAINLGLIAVVAVGPSFVSDVIAPLTGHLIGIGLSASAALTMRRCRIAVLTAGTLATFVVHAWLGLARCCEAPRLADKGATRLAALHAPVAAAPTLNVIALNTSHVPAHNARLGAYLATAAAAVVVLWRFGPSTRPLLEDIRSTYPSAASMVRSCSPASSTPRPGPARFAC